MMIETTMTTQDELPAHEERDDVRGYTTNDGANSVAPEPSLSLLGLINPVVLVNVVFFRWFW